MQKNKQKSAGQIVNNPEYKNTRKEVNKNSSKVIIINNGNSTNGSKKGGISVSDANSTKKNKSRLLVMAVNPVLRFNKLV